MLFRHAFLQRIEAGTIKLAFQRWQRPTVRSHGTLLVAVGQLQIGEVTNIEIESITASDARQAGYSSLAELLDVLNARETGSVYRIELGDLRPDPRSALRASVLNSEKPPGSRRAWTTGIG